MKRLRLLALGAATVVGFTAGCSNMSVGHGQLMSRIRGQRADCADVGCCPTCDGPALGDGMMTGPAMPSGFVAPPPGAFAQPALPPLAPPPRIDPNQAQPTPAGPTSRLK